MRRRDVLRAGGLAGAATLLVPALPSHAAAPAFQHGVASGDPLPDRVILWTRVTPADDATPGSGVGPDVTVRWQIATDADFRDVVASGAVRTGPARDHTVKVDADGLAPGRWYFYRFAWNDQHSAIGRTRTAPPVDVQPDRLRFGVVSCSNWQSGHFASYQHLAERGDVDVVLHLGDYLYEYAPGEYGSFRRHDPPHEMTTLADYRRRHAQYKTDPQLQALHAACPWIITWDDHETANDAWSGGAENHTEGAEGSWVDRRRQARRAYAEWMPIRFGSGGRLYRRLRFGTLAELTMLDLRSYRSKQASSVGEADDADRTLVGADQLAFLRDSLTADDVQWKLIGNPVIFSPLLLPPVPRIVGTPLADLTGLVPEDGVPFNVDQWDGYQHERRELIRLLANQGVQNTVFLTGDIHTSWAFEVPVDAGAYPLSRTVATEFVVPSVTSDNIDELTGAPPRTASVSVEQAAMALNRHLKWVELDSHGYTVCDVSADRVQVDWYFLADREDARSAARHAKSFAVTSGTQRLREVSDPV
ncbi:MAG: alkaline phosphatase [Actinophytocola sp.]|nr:alkaline phosphatase [Actinophytocola sp.]